ncbi:hypothetical protein FISHEDRAFT_56096 [Fistulina hepatica ATCC 64428]|uniref:Peptidase M24 domain-containing protein n=1 Tax=Fistulina hepatica ATCC 64428 TaxID=1128425 RepID=A0A0D7AM43_9AGAR|nr:hypothetical protein FISHEDRAFT_56096 [Fistulina hepatica ATCC 64428]
MQKIAPLSGPWNAPATIPVPPSIELVDCPEWSTLPDEKNVELLHSVGVADSGYLQLAGCVMNSETPPSDARDAVTLHAHVSKADEERVRKKEKRIRHLPGEVFNGEIGVFLLESILQQGDLMKVNFEVRGRGRIVDSAFTMAFDHTYDKLLEAVRAATDTGIQEAGIDVHLGKLAGYTQETMESYEVEIGGKVYPDSRQSLRRQTVQKGNWLHPAPVAA